jgi:hypothetical protein
MTLLKVERRWKLVLMAQVFYVYLQVRIGKPISVHGELKTLNVLTLFVNVVRLVENYYRALQVKLILLS